MLTKAIYRFTRIIIESFVLWNSKRSNGDISIGSGLICHGMPLIEACAGSKIQIGRDVVMTSNNFGNVIGVNHCVIIRTLRTSAKITIGNAVGMSGCSIVSCEKITISDHCSIGANCIIVDNDQHDICPAARLKSRAAPTDSRPIILEDNVWLGANVIVLKGVVIGKGSVIAAGAVVTKSIPENTMAAGVPAKVIRQLSIRS